MKKEPLGAEFHFKYGFGNISEEGANDAGIYFFISLGICGILTIGGKSDIIES
jgi:hypothetical protein